MDTNCLTKKIGRPIGFLGDNIFYEDKGCKYAKELKYEGTCLPSKDYPNGCPFTHICLEDVHDNQQKEYRDNKIRELYYEQGLSYTNISNITGLKISVIENAIHSNNTEKYKNNLLYSSV